MTIRYTFGSDPDALHRAMLQVLAWDRSPSLDSSATDATGGTDYVKDNNDAQQQKQQQ